MADEKELKLAGEVYRTICRMLDERDWKYGKEEDKMIIFFGVNGDDLNMPFVIYVDASRQLVRMSSRFPFEIPESERVPVAVALNYVNYRLADGSFDFNLADGTVTFRITTCFKESLIGTDLFSYMVDCTTNTVDDYNDKVLALAKKEIDLTKFVELV